ncbi:MAG TPA: nidogen-like domain-containing protein [Polyangiaceae bacterium]|nr:nidogen-like domain-containing protein [Polyangiaceae bacterium]
MGAKPVRRILLFCLALVALFALATCARGGPTGDADEAPVGSVEAGLQCGCSATGPYLPPAQAAPRAPLPSDLFRIEAPPVAPGQPLRVAARRNSDDAIVYSVEIPNNHVGASLGLDPNGTRLTYSFTNSLDAPTQRTVHAVDLLAPSPAPVSQAFNVAGAAFDLGFSPHGTYLFVAAPTAAAPPGLRLAVADLRKGASAFTGAFVRTVAATLPPDPSLDTVGDVTWGFSPDDDAFAYAHRTGEEKPIHWSLANLVSGRDVRSFPNGSLEPVGLAAGSSWSFSPCGDTVGLATPPPAAFVPTPGRVFETSGGLPRLEGSQSSALLPTFRSTTTQHQILFNGTPAFNVANEAGIACPTAFPVALTFAEPSVVGGRLTSGTVVLSQPAPAGGLTIKLQSDDTDLARVPTTVPVPEGASSATFSIVTLTVAAPADVALHATLGTIDQVAFLRLTPAPPRAIASLTASSPSVTAGTALSGTVTLAGFEGLTAVTLQVDNPAASLPTAAFDVSTGEPGVTFAIQTSAVLVTTPVTITATTDAGSTATVTFDVSPDVQPSELVPCSGLTLPPNDDGSAPPFPVPFDLNFFGAQTDLLHVNNNGNVTFEGPMATFTPFAITANTRPIIAPFFADVDTRGTPANPVVYGQTTFEGRPAVCVSWVDVGYFSQHNDKLNRFQLVLVDRSADFVAGDFDIVMNYNQILWETGDASNGTDGFGGISAGAGYSAGTNVDGQFFEFPGSREPGSLLDSNPTTGLTRTRRNSLSLGRHIFPVRNGVAPVGASVLGQVTANGAAPLADAPVQVCRVSDGRCVFYTLSTLDGRYAATSVPPGTYVATAYPPAGSSLLPATSAPFDVGASNLTVNLNLVGPAPLPPGTSIGPTHGATGGVPVVNWSEPLSLRTLGCQGGQAQFSVTQGTTTLASGALTEAPPPDFLAGTFAGTIPPFFPNHGQATVNVAIDCPDGKPDESLSFSIYIDPSGNIVTPSGDRVPDAIVTLFRSDSPSGPFEPVPDGSAIMSPSNRKNPDRSDAQGHYGWDVIAGYYIVRAQKEGCLALDGGPFVESHVLTIPPPVTDLDLVLDCPDADLTPPTVEVSLPTPPGGGIYQGPVDLTLNASDAGFGVVGILFELSGAQSGAGSTSGDQVTLHVHAEGETVVTYWAVDAAGNETQRQTLVIRIDTVAPTIACSVTPSQLWPPNHKLVDVGVSVQVEGATGFTLVSASSNEPDAGQGGGDKPGDISDFAVGTSDVAGKLRAERSGKGNGREYSLVYEAVDAAGNAAQCTAVVRVPHSLGQK